MLSSKAEKKGRSGAIKKADFRRRRGRRPIDAQDEEGHVGVILREEKTTRLLAAWGPGSRVLAELVRSPCDEGCEDRSSDV